MYADKLRRKAIGLANEPNHGLVISIFSKRSCPVDKDHTLHAAAAEWFGTFLQGDYPIQTTNATLTSPLTWTCMLASSRLKHQLRVREAVREAQPWHPPEPNYHEMATGRTDFTKCRMDCSSSLPLSLLALNIGVHD